MSTLEDDDYGEFGDEWGGGATEAPEEQEGEQRYGTVSSDLTDGTGGGGEDEISYVYDYAEIDLAEKRKQVESLRSVAEYLKSRRKSVMSMIAKLVGKGVIADLSTLDGTEEEIQPIYEEQLMTFKDVKEKAMDGYRKLLSEMKVKTEYCETLRKKNAEITDEQYDLELKTGVGMIHSKTQKELTHNDVVKMLNSSKVLNHKLSLRWLKYKSVKRDFKDLNDMLENMASLSINYVEFVEIPNRNISIEHLLNDLYNKISADRDIIKLHLGKRDDIAHKMKQLQELKENKETELKRLKDEWRSGALAKWRRQKHQEQLEKARTPDIAFGGDGSRSRRFYRDCVERARWNEERSDQLRGTMAEAKAVAGRLRSLVNGKGDVQNYLLMAAGRSSDVAV